MPSVNRGLIEIGKEWVCSGCGRQFYNPGCDLAGLTVTDIIQHVQKFREHAFAKHVCPKAASVSESVADILEHELDTVIAEWLIRAEREPDLMSIRMNNEDRTGHLPHLLHDIIARLRLEAGTISPVSTAAAKHGALRRKQGYTVAMAVEESRLLQVSIFSRLHNSAKQSEMSLLLPDVATIADEVDAQLKEQMVGFMAEYAPEDATDTSVRPSQL